jgi:acyl-CoA reductase-like NAD-dependent aldehyde dehydrogenase
MRTGDIFIDGHWTHAINQGIWNLINPGSEEVIREVSYGDGQDAVLAISAASNAFPSWSHTNCYQRAAILKKTADIIRQKVDVYSSDMVLESGKPKLEAMGEWMVVANLFEWYAEEAKRNYGRQIPANRSDKRMLVMQQPMGVIGIITAWNFPAYNPARAVAAAIAAGCTLVLKGSEYTPLSAIHLVNALVEAGIPKGVINLINGDAASIGEVMLSSVPLRKISFTGSTRVGKILMDGASKSNTRLGLELGGNAPVIITKNVEVAKLAKAAVTARFRNCGQVCVAPQRFYVQEDIYQEFSKQVVEHTKALLVGIGSIPETQLGPLINSQQRKNVIDIIDKAIQEGAHLETGGKIPSALKKGYFLEPAVFTSVKQGSILTKHEIFGPVIPLIPFAKLEQAITWANDTEYGLAAYAFTSNLEDSIHLSEELHFGIIGINEWAAHGTEGPFGGWKQSGQGHESGMEGMQEYMEKKLVSIGSISPYSFPQNA